MTPTLIDTDNPEFQNALKLIQYTRHTKPHPTPPPIGLSDRKSGNG